MQGRGLTPFLLSFGIDDLSCTWKLDSTAGGVVDIALIAQGLDGTELARDTVRVSSIPCQPSSGRIIFVNPSSSSPAQPYDNFTQNAAHTIADALTTMLPEDNIVLAKGTYHENGLQVPSAGGISGLAGQWLVPDPANGTDPYTLPLDESFDFSNVPILDAGGLPRASICSASGIGSGLGLGFGGLAFTNGRGADSPYPAVNAGGALRLENITVPVRIRFCTFGQNSSTDFGGAIYFLTVPDAKISICEFSRNKAEHDDGGTTPSFSGMGGAVAGNGFLGPTALTVSECTFLANTGAVTSAGSAPLLGSAGGGGDIYLKQASLTFTHSRSWGAVAGFPKAPSDQPASYFTGDGGSILVQGQIANNLQISSSRFTRSTAYGNGGAISLSFDSSPEGRQWFVPTLGPNWPLPIDPYPRQLSGACNGSVVNTLFEQCEGGWQGGAVAINGTGMHLNLQDCVFQSCEAGAVQPRDGKGGGVATCGGVQSTDWPQDEIHLNHCTVSRCIASGNGGGLYVTIRALVNVENNSSVDHCIAQNRAGTQYAMSEGFGGAIHTSAGGDLRLFDGTVLTANIAVNGGGLGVKSAGAGYYGAVTIRGNRANSTVVGHGNGAGVLITTSFYDDGPPHGPGWGAALVFASDGSFYSSGQGTLLVENNLATRFGGGIYVGIAPPWWDVNWWHAGNHAASVVTISSATVQNNQGYGGVVVGQTMLNNTQVVAERVRNDLLSTAALSLQNSTMTGSPADIGLYLWDSLTPVMVNLSFPTLDNPIIIQP